MRGDPPGSVEEAPAISLPRRDKAVLFAVALSARIVATAVIGFPGAVAYGKIVNGILGAAMALVLASIALRLFGSLRAARIAGVLAAIHPGFVVLGTEVQ